VIVDGGFEVMTKLDHGLTNVSGCLTQLIWSLALMMLIKKLWHPSLPPLKKSRPEIRQLD
jgi:hypothetical protein